MGLKKQQQKTRPLNAFNTFVMEMLEDLKCKIKMIASASKIHTKYPRRAQSLFDRLMPRRPKYTDV